MSLINNIQNALNTKLAAVSGIPTVYYPNTNREPIQATNWVRPTLLPGNSQLDTLNEYDFHQGIYQVDIFTQLNKGTAPILLIADSIRDAFKRQSLTSGGDIIHIQEISMSPARRDEGWWTCYVQINYICFN